MCTRRLALAASLTSLLAACGGDLPAGGLAVADSVALACTPVLSPGPDDEGVISDFAPGPDGLMVWTTDGNATNLVIGTALNQATTAGRKGEGPGEFAFVEKIGWSGDTVWATDLMQSRVQYFDRNGTYLSGHRLPQGGGWAPTPDGRFLGVGSKPIRATGWSVLQVAGDSAAPTADTLYHFPGPGSVIVNVPMKDGGALMTSNPFLPTAQVVAAPDHSRFCGSEPLEGNQARIRCIDDRGTIYRDTVVTLTPMPLTDAVWNRMIDRYVRDDASQRSSIEQLFTRPTSLPPVTALGVDRDGSLWIDRSHSSDTVQHWLRLAPDGTLRDTLLLTRGHIAHLSGDTLWRSWSDADGMQSVERCVARRKR